MAKENSFDIVSKTDYAEVTNALNQTEKEISQRFDFKGSKASAELQQKDLMLAAEDEIPVLVFDEVDANVGGETANAVGEKMRQIAAKRQVICITHLPQVAAPADAHYVVTKSVSDGRTISEIKLLDKKSRIAELTRMLGGQGDAARKHAEALLK